MMRAVEMTEPFLQANQPRTANEEFWANKAQIGRVGRASGVGHVRLFMLPTRVGAQRHGRSTRRGSLRHQGRGVQQRIFQPIEEDARLALALTSISRAPICLRATCSTWAKSWAMRDVKRPTTRKKKKKKKKKKERKKKL